MSIYQELLNQYQQLQEQQLPPELQAVLGTDFSGYVRGSLTPEQTAEINRIQSLIEGYQATDRGIEAKASARTREIRSRRVKLQNLARRARQAGDRRAEARYKEKARRLGSAERKFSSLFEDILKFKPGQEDLGDLIQQIKSLSPGTASTAPPTPITGGGGTTPPITGGGGTTPPITGGGGTTPPITGGGGTTPPISDPGAGGSGVITQPGTANNQLSDLLAQFGPDSVLASFNDAANRTRERLGGLANAQRQGITNDALGRGVGAANFTQQRLDQSNRDELGAYGQALTQLGSEFENRRLQSGGVAGDIAGKILGGEQFNRQINLDKLISDRNFQLGKATVNNNNLSAILNALLGQLG